MGEFLVTTGNEQFGKTAVGLNESHHLALILERSAIKLENSKSGHDLSSLSLSSLNKRTGFHPVRGDMFIDENAYSSQTRFEGAERN